MKLSTIPRKFKTLHHTVKSFTSGKWDYITGAFDMVYCRLRYKVPTDEYLYYKFYNYKHRYRKHFILQWQRNKFVNLNTRAFTKSKYTFYKYIPDLFFREMIIAPFCGEDTFVDFLRKHKKIVVKPDRGSLGEGLVVAHYTDDAAAKAFFAQISSERPMICEEFIRQHPVLSQLNPTSVNTLRITSLLRNGEVEILSATLKTGAGTERITDNLSQGGIGAQVDVKTGIVCTFGKDFDLNDYPYHPTTGAPILGLQIPNWDIAIDLIKTAHKRVPQCLYYGWDIAITETGADIVEANSKPGSRIMQVMDGIPKGQVLLPLLNEDHLKEKRDEYTKEFQHNYSKYSFGK